MRRASNKQLHFEIALIRATQSLDEVRISDVVMALERGANADRPPLTPEEPASTTPAPGERTKDPEPPTPPDNTPRPSSRARKKRRNVENQLESLIEQAPEKRPEIAPQSDPAAPQSVDSPAPAEPPAQESFYDDPLVHDALRIFKGKLKE
jgi:DNA polymerase-3 subunit gamma/tau